MSVLHLLEGPGMESRVELFAAIRRDSRVEDLSIRELADRHHVHSTETVVPGPAANSARPAVPGPADPLGADILGLLRSLKLSGMKDTLPERLSLARSRQMSHATFLELLLSDEVSRRDARSAAVRAMQAGLAPLLRLDTWNEHDNLVYDRGLLADLTSLRFTE